MRRINCKKCGGKVKEGQALINSKATSKSGDVSFTVPSAKIVSCLKCVRCGHSFTKDSEKEKIKLG